MSSSMPTNNRPADCVCNLGHCAACLRAGIVCERPGCKATRSDGRPCPGLVPPPPPSGTRRAPAMPQPELVDEPRVCTTAEGIEDALRASLRPAPTPPALLTPREREARKERHEERAQLGRIRASTESYPARPLTLDDLDAHERPRYAMMRSR